MEINIYINANQVIFLIDLSATCVRRNLLEDIAEMMRHLLLKISNLICSFSC